MMRRSTIEVYPSVSEAPCLRSSISYPTTDFSKNQICIPMSKLMTQEYKNIIFRNKIGIPTILGQGIPSFRNQFGRNVLPLS